MDFYRLERRRRRHVSPARSRFQSPDLRVRRCRIASSALRNRRILVVEDEYLIAMNLQDGLENIGSVVLGPVPSVEKAIKTIESESHIDAVILDVNLGGALAYPVADLLVALKIPFVFTSGYEDTALRSRYSGVKNCTKPYLFQAIEEALIEAMSHA
jgi:CheY-like chemotaxis protein